MGKREMKTGMERRMKREMKREGEAHTHTCADALRCFTVRLLHSVVLFFYVFVLTSFAFSAFLFMAYICLFAVIPLRYDGAGKYHAPSKPDTHSQLASAQQTFLSRSVFDLLFAGVSRNTLLVLMT